MLRFYCTTPYSTTKQAHLIWLSKQTRNCFYVLRNYCTHWKYMPIEFLVGFRYIDLCMISIQPNLTYNFSAAGYKYHWQGPKVDRPLWLLALRVALQLQLQVSLQFVFDLLCSCSSATTLQTQVWFSTVVQLHCKRVFH